MYYLLELDQIPFLFQQPSHYIHHRAVRCVAGEGVFVEQQLQVQINDI